MKLDIATLVLVTSIVFLTQTVGVFLQFRVNKAYRGLGWWLAGVILFALGFLLMPLVLVPSLRSFAGFANPLVILGLFFLGVGVDEFFGRKKAFRPSYLLPVLGIGLYSLFVFLPGGMRGRSAVVAATTSAVALRIAWLLFRERKARFRESISFCAAVFAAYGFFQAGMAGVTLVMGASASYSSIADSPARTLMFILPIVCGTLWNYGFIIMMNQRLHSANRELVAQLAREKSAAELNSVTDTLTGLMNRRFFDESLRTEFFRLKRSRAPLSLILLDVDHFKAYNDAYGHVAGDDCLRRVASAIRLGAKRLTDVAARYGGEEFAVILPETDAAGALEIAERIREGVEGLGIPHSASLTSGRVTLSAGVVTLVPEELLDCGEVVSRADFALYEAKRAGRNRVVVAGT